MDSRKPSIPTPSSAHSSMPLRGLALILFTFALLGFPFASVTAEDEPVPACKDDLCACFERSGKYYVDCSYVGLNLIPIVPDFTSRLYLTGNNITQIGYNNNVLPYLPKLKKLFLNGNPLKLLHPKAFVNVSGLNVLLMHYTAIETIDSAILNLTYLEELWVNNANLQTIGDKAFSKAPNLKIIYLQNNNISEIPDSSFDGLSKLQKLDLSYNPLFEPSCCDLCGLKAQKTNLIVMSRSRKSHLKCGCDTAPLQCTAGSVSPSTSCFTTCQTFPMFSGGNSFFSSIYMANACIFIAVLTLILERSWI